MGVVHNMVLIFCFSVANPPNLQEWTDRAETFDNLTNSVSTIPLYCILVLFLSKMRNKNLSAITGKNCNGREICWDGRFLFVCGEGGFPPLSPFSLKWSE